MTVGLISIDVEISSSFSLFDEEEDDADIDDAVTFRFLVVFLAVVTGPSSK